MATPDDGSPRRERGPRSNPPIRKNLGQHFLNDRRILQRLVDALELGDADTVIEIGPGRGSLTALLVPAARKLVLIEYDRALAAQLRTRYASTPNVSVVEADVLTVNLSDAAGGGAFRLIGNVPYYITTPILFHALEHPRPERAVYLVQREVAERIVAAPGSDDYGALSVNVQATSIAKLLFRVAPGAFNPPPKVESAAVSVEPRNDPVVTPSEEVVFRRFVLDAFGMRRKQLRRVIRSVWQISVEQADAALAAAAIDPTARPETLSPEQFAALLRARPAN
ncbi:MAG TPA: 16S rRNA (adenine(1518)-N(6)/adenine(1519)-N(6))-dimethyltransferase RsmA [Gemmatimonadaceae bacterium]|jgi:16S rRNA (adenine1518-N6/adenine1519-N6)-dimethyltransferase